MILFKIVDRKTGKEPTDRVITAQARLGNLIPCNIDGFYVGEDGQIILVDNCGNCTWLDMNRFKVELQTEVLDKIRERVELEKLGYPPSAGYYRAIMKVLQIIDKYKAESEEKE